MKDFGKLIIRISVTWCLLYLVSCDFSKQADKEEQGSTETTSLHTTFSFQEITGIGQDSLYNRRDNSDVIKVGDTYYIWYSKMKSPITSGYWATIWYATSKDEGFTWQEQGMALGLGEKGAFDSHSVFTPNILAHDGKYYLYYTGVKPTPSNSKGAFEGNHTSGFYCIGLAVSNHPDGPFKRVVNNPVLAVSQSPNDFDSYRVDDASLLVKDGQIWLYYKGRSIIHGSKGPRLTEMGVAFADSTQGPYIKHKGAIIDKSHEVMIWKKGDGVASLASISQSINYAEDGINFMALVDSLKSIPKAPGLFRPDLTGHKVTEDAVKWGISMKARKGETYLVRFEMR